MLHSQDLQKLMVYFMAALKKNLVMVFVEGKILTFQGHLVEVYSWIRRKISE